MAKKITLNLTLTIPDNPALTNKGYEELVAKAIIPVAKEGRIDRLHIEACECYPANILIAVEKGLARVSAVGGEANVIIADFDGRDIHDEGAIENEVAPIHVEGTQDDFERALREAKERLRAALPECDPET